MATDFTKQAVLSGMFRAVGNWARSFGGKPAALGAKPGMTGAQANIQQRVNDVRNRIVAQRKDISLQQRAAQGGSVQGAISAKGLPPAEFQSLLNTMNVSPNWNLSSQNLRRMSPPQAAQFESAAAARVGRRYPQQGGLKVNAPMPEPQAAGATRVFTPPALTPGVTANFPAPPGAARKGEFFAPPEFGEYLT
jgi:hypothetical protein